MSKPDFTRLINLANPRMGAAVTYSTDDFFADKARLIDPADPVFIPGKYDDNGKWMDGWESRRKRDIGYDHCIIRLGQPGVIAGFNIDTSHFTGNYPRAAAIEACVFDGDVPDDYTEWTDLVPAMNLNGNSHHFVEISDKRAWTHLRFNIYPDGGVARLRVYGTMHKDWDAGGEDAEHDLLSMENGGRAIVAVDEHFGVLSNITLPGKGENMGDGWETRRRREPGCDWAILELGHVGTINRIMVDTAFFKGNFPDGISIQAAKVTGGTDDSLPVQSQYWKELLPQQSLTADAEHNFIQEINALGPISHIRVNIFPDGGISRLRLFGTLAK
jgi:allantoicase